MQEQEKENGLFVQYDIGCFMDEVTLSLLYHIREDDRKTYLLFKNGRGKDITIEEAVKWILEKYTNKNDDSEGLKEEKMYMLHLMGIGATKIGEYFGVSRQTVHKKIKNFEDNRLQKFIKPWAV